MKFDVLRRFERKKVQVPSEKVKEGTRKFMGEILTLGRRESDEEVNEAVEIARERMLEEMFEISSARQIEVKVSRFNEGELKDLGIKALPTFVFTPSKSDVPIEILSSEMPLDLTTIRKQQELNLHVLDYLLVVTNLDHPDQNEHRVRIQFVFPGEGKPQNNLDRVRRMWDKLRGLAINSEEQYGQFSWIVGVNPDKFD